MPGFKLFGPISYRIRNISLLLWSSLAVSLRRLLRGPLLPGWSWNLETSVYYLLAQSLTAFKLPTPQQERQFFNTLVFNSPILEEVEFEKVVTPVKGDWIRPKQRQAGRVLLYMHGGGFSFYTKSHIAMIAFIAQAAKADTFSLDYRLIPEYPYPAQLEDALAAYRWLLENGIDPRHIVVAGDSAGGNLALAMMLTLRRDNLPQPALVITISPWTDVTNPGESIIANQRYDWVDNRQANKWAKQYCAGNDPNYPLISPVKADLTGLAPIYIQAGGHEMLIDMIQQFYHEAQSQGAEIKLDVWEYMIHDFQAFAQFLPEAQEALDRIGQEVDRRLR
jgi:acetyl esterase/lipase